MKLSDVMGAMGLSAYAELGLLLFVFAFVLIALDLLRTSKKEIEHAQRLPLEDERKERRLP